MDDSTDTGSNAATPSSHQGCEGIVSLTDQINQSIQLLQHLDELHLKHANALLFVSGNKLHPEIRKGVHSQVVTWAKSIGEFEQRLKKIAAPLVKEAHSLDVDAGPLDTFLLRSVRDNIAGALKVLRQLEAAELAREKQANRDAASPAGDGDRNLGKAVVGGVTQEQALDLAKPIVHREGWPGLKPLAKRVGCDWRTLKKALELPNPTARFLKARKAEADHEKRARKKPRFAGTGGRQPDPIDEGLDIDAMHDQIDGEDELKRLMAEQDADERRDQRKAKRRQDNSR